MPTDRKGAKRPVHRRYTVYFLRDEIAGGYTAHVPALGIVTEGETLKDAQTMARDAIEGRLAVLEELGQPIPLDVKFDTVEV